MPPAPRLLASLEQRHCPSGPRRAVGPSWPRVLAVAVVAILIAASCSSDGTPEGSSNSGEPDKTVGSGDTYEATVVRTSGGVPHITGATKPDAAFGQGYASGQDRACDLADQVLKVRGERARWFGAGDEDEHLNSDIQWRAIGIFDLASQDWETQVTAETQEIFTAFAAGWNTQLDEVGVDGLAGWCAGQDWVRAVEPVEIYAYARAVTLSASGTRIGALIATAQPPSTEATQTPTAKAPGTIAGSADAASPEPGGEIGGSSTAPLASNGWAIGSERSENGYGMLMANPHFPWEGEFRFWENHLTVPGEYDVYGIQLSGAPGIAIGFTEDFAWTHTVSDGKRFTAYQIDLVPGSPTTYRYGDESREMVATDHVIEVLGDDGEVGEVEHQTWATHYGPVVDFPGFGWTEESTITYRDANIDNDEFVEQFFGVPEADDLEGLKKVHMEQNGVPLFNTMAVSADGEAWYADTSATPNLSDEALAAYEVALETDPITQAAADNSAILLDGSDPLYEWVDEPGARDPGLVPAEDQPQITRNDYVFNANDSFWMPHATELISGDYSPLHGRQETGRSPRTRENATLLADTSADGPSGADGFTVQELADASLANRGFMARALLDEMVQRCTGADAVTVPELTSDDERASLPAGEVEVSAACEVLADWDGIYDNDRAGPLLWREFLSRYDSTDYFEAGALWAEPFDPAEPVATPSGLNSSPVEGSSGNDPALESLARAVQALEVAGLELDAPLGEVQFSLRNGEKIAIHGGGFVDGTTNMVWWDSGASILDPAVTERDRERLVTHSEVSQIEGHTGYPVAFGTSFLMAMGFSEDGPEARILHSYGNTEDRTAEAYVDTTRQYSDKTWRDAAFTEDQVAENTISITTVLG